MRIVSIDIETTGINRDYCQVLEVGAVIFDTSKGFEQFDKTPKFKCIVDNGKQIQGEPYAINMNARIFDILAKMEDIKDKDSRMTHRSEHNILPPSMIGKALKSFLLVNGFVEENDRVVINVAGKNFGTFDLQFLEGLPQWNKYIKVRSRILDPAILYYDENDDSLPGLQNCMDRSGLFEGKSVTHDALEDAIDTAKLVIKGLERLK